MAVRIVKKIGTVTVAAKPAAIGFLSKYDLMR